MHCHWLHDSLWSVSPLFSTWRALKLRGTWSLTQSKAAFKLWCVNLFSRKEHTGTGTDWEPGPYLGYPGINSQTLRAGPESIIYSSPYFSFYIFVASPTVVTWPKFDISQMGDPLLLWSPELGKVGQVGAVKQKKFLSISWDEHRDCQ